MAIQHYRNLKRSKEDFLAELRLRHKHRSYELIELLMQARYQTSMHALQVLVPPNPDYVQLIKNLPTLLVIGDIDPVVTPEVASELVKINQQLRFTQISDAGHGVFYDQPECFSAEVQSFLCYVNKVL